MSNKYHIEPSNEPDGPETGWELCAEDKATCWIVYRNNEEQIGAFSSRQEAEEVVAYNEGFERH
jgi:hypothetical protein